MKIAHIAGKIYIFWATWEILETFSGKMWLMIILKLKKKQGLILSLKDTFLEKPEGVYQTDPPPPPSPSPLSPNSLFKH